MVASATGFEMFWQNYVLLYAAPILQMALWVVEIFVFVYAIILLKRWVEFATGAAKAPAGMASAPAKAAEKPVNVDEFVE